MDKFIDDNFENVKKDLNELISIRSINSDDEKPFGKNNKDVLATCLKMMERIGLKTKNLDDYCGYGEIGEGNELIGIVGHLDVVPEGDGWDYDPYKLTEKDGLLYGRGVADDKGPVIASLYALKYLIDTGYKFKKRVRLIVGCNEESGSNCIKHYVEKEGHIDMGFTPDGNFPGIFAEKGMIGGLLVSSNSKIKNIEGGVVTNAVCNKVTCEVPSGSFNEDKFKEFLDHYDLSYKIEGNKLTVFGKSAHASLPDEGVNAINFLLEALYYADFNDSLTDFFHQYIGLTLHGEKLGFEVLKDDISDTSLNIGMAFMKDDKVNLTIDMRFPVKAHKDDCLALFAQAKDDNNSFELMRGMEPLYFDKELPMIRALLNAYQNVTKDFKHGMLAIGGGTYAKTINNCIAFGPEMPGCDYNLHGANEHLGVDELKLQIKAYGEAIENLNEV